MSWSPPPPLTRRILSEEDFVKYIDSSDDIVMSVGASKGTWINQLSDLEVYNLHSLEHDLVYTITRTTIDELSEAVLISLINKCGNAIEYLHNPTNNMLRIHNARWVI